MNEWAHETVNKSLGKERVEAMSGAMTTVVNLGCGIVAVSRAFRITEIAMLDGSDFVGFRVSQRRLSRSQEIPSFPRSTREKVVQEVLHQSWSD